ncbi:MAG: cobalamin-dependent protein, partial [Patescibacteria group bacterium]
MKAILIYPKARNGFWNGQKAIRRYLPRQKTALPPYGLLTVASMLPKEWEKKLVDLNVEKLTDEHIEWADVVLISAMISQSKSTLEIIKRCKKRYKIIMAGGALFNEPEKFPEVDYIFIGEAENTLPRFLKDLEKGTTKR